MGAEVCRGAFGVTLQFALARGTRGFSVAGRELNLARRRRRTPWLLVAVSEVMRLVAARPARGGGRGSLPRNVEHLVDAA